MVPPAWWWPLLGGENRVALRYFSPVDSKWCPVPSEATKGCLHYVYLLQLETVDWQWYGYWLLCVLPRV